MRTPRWCLAVFLLAVPAIASDQAEEPANAASPNAVIDQAIANIGRRGLLRRFSPREFPPARVCSVPLVEMPVPTDKRYTMKELRIEKDPRSKDVVPFSAMPAPPCSATPDGRQ